MTLPGFGGGPLRLTPPQWAAEHWPRVGEKRYTSIVSFSGGASSWAAARLIRDADPDRPMVLLFADTLIEDEDTYRFLEEASADLGVPVTRVADGRTPWEVFRQNRFLANHRVDLCSRVLKRDLLNAWRTRYFEPHECESVIGLDATEDHRFRRYLARAKPWRARAPLIEAGLFKREVHDMVARAGLREQRLYRMGAPHANCGGGCVKMGMSGFARLLDRFPQRFAEWEREEEAIREFLGQDVSILADRRGGGPRRPLTLRELRRRRQERRLLLPVEPEEGGCGCAID